MSLTKTQREELAARLNIPYETVHLRCDGYQVSLVAELYKALQYRVRTYVNGRFHGAWMLGSQPAPEQKFLRPSVRAVFTPAARKKWEKALGKRAVKADPHFNKTYTTYCPDWANGKQAISHLCRVCDSVEVWTDGMTPAAPAQPAGEAHA